MKTAVIYYSHDGNCALVADILKTEFNADVFRIETLDDKKRKGILLMFWGGGQVFRGIKPPLKPLSVDINAYDLIILGTPVWAGSPTPAIVSFLDKNSITGKKIALFCCHGGGMGKALDKLKAQLNGNTVIGEIDFKLPAKADNTGVKQKLSAWVKTLINTNKP
jgi:flavodoxin